MNSLSQCLLLLVSLVVLIQSYALPTFEQPTGEELPNDDGLALNDEELWEAFQGAPDNDADLFSRLTRGSSQEFSRDRRRVCVSDCSFCHSFFPTYKLGNCFHGCRRGFHDPGCKQFRY